jgi:hypothetical protein
MQVSFTSCSDELDGNEEVKKDEEPTVMVSVNVSSELGTSGAKTRSIGMADDGNGKLSYNFNKLYEQQGDTGAFDFILTARYGDKISTNLFENVPIKIKSDGTYYISLSGIDIAIPAAVSTEENVENLKFCGMLVPNGTGGVFDNFVKGGVWKDMAELSRLAANDKKFFVPLYSNTQITTKEYNWGGSLDKTNFNINLQFSMMGTVITAKFNGNPLVNDIYVDSVRMRYSNVKSGAIQWKMGDEQDNGYPNFTYGDGEETDNKKLSFPQPMLVESDLFNTTNEVYTDTAWVMPVSTDDFINSYDIYYHIKGDVEYDSTSMVVSYPQDGNTTTHTGGFEYGKVYTLSMSMPESDLMITEFEHYNPGGANYSMIELYNPTVNNIDLREYGLVRLTDLEESSEAWLAYDGSNLSYASTNFDNARVQDIYIDATDFTFSTTETFDGPATCKTVNGTSLPHYGALYQFENTYAIFAGNNTSLRAYPTEGTYTYKIGTHTYTTPVALKPYELGPGQTVIVGAAKLEKFIVEGTTDDEHWHSNSLYFNSSYLDYAANKNRLKFAVGVDNGANSDANGGEKFVRAGVMQHVQRNIIQLVKKNSDSDAEHKYDVIDYPGDIETTEARSIYINYLQGTKLTTTPDYFVMSRDPSALYPRYLVNDQIYTDMENRQEVLHRFDTGTFSNGTPYRMFDWTWIYPNNFNISYTNSFTLENYLNSYYSPGTKSFEEAIYNNE